MFRGADHLGKADAACAAASDLDPVDLRHLRRYTLGDLELEREVLGLFLEQLPRSLGALATASTEADWRMAAHALKGSGRAVGAWRIAAFAEEAEHDKRRNPRACREMVMRLAAAAEDARAFIASRYGAIGSPAADA